MNGKTVKEKLMKEGYVLADIAREMGTIPQNLQTLLSTSDIKTGVLEKIAQAINKSIYFFFEEEEGKENIENDTSTKYLEVIKEQSYQLNKYQEQIDRLLTIIENLSGKSQETK